MRVLIAPQRFGDALSAVEAAEALARPTVHHEVGVALDLVDDAFPGRRGQPVRPGPAREVDGRGNDRAAAVVSSLIDDFVAQSLGGPGA